MICDPDPSRARNVDTASLLWLLPRAEPSAKNGERSQDTVGFIYETTSAGTETNWMVE